MTHSASRKPRETTMVPVMTMEEVPVLSEEERQDLLQSLKDAEARIAAGDFIEYDPTEFRERLLSIYRDGARGATSGTTMVSGPGPTTAVPTVTMAEVPVLSAGEQAELVQSLKEAEAQIDAGDFVELHPDQVDEWLHSLYRGDEPSGR